MTAASQNRSYYPALDGLRGLASLLVVIYHNFGFINHYFFFGWIGLDIFFVLSGFLITDILLNTLHRKDYLQNFYMRRMLRVFPIYYAGLILFLVILPRFPDMMNYFSYYVNNQVYLWTYLQNWLYVFNPPPQHQSILNHLWSLAVEEQFYLLWPLVFLLIKKPKYLLALIGLLLVLVIGLRYWSWTSQVQDLSYYNLYTFTRIDGICIGCMVALLQKINPGFLRKYTAAIVLAFAGFNFMFFFFNRENQFTFPYLAIAGYSTVAMLFGLLVYDIIHERTKLLIRIFSNRILKFFGRVSYGCYIIHWPLYLLLSPYLLKWITPYISGHPKEFMVSFIATALSYLLGYLSYRYFESYFLKLKKRFE